MSIQWDATLESRFQEKLERESASSYRTILLVMIPFFALFASVDFVLQTHELFLKLLYVRAAAIAVLSTAFIWVRRPEPPKWIPDALILVLAFSLTLFAVLTQGYESSFHFGMSLVVFCVSLLFSWGPGRVAKWVLFISLTYLVSVTVAAHFKIENTVAYTNNIAFLSGSCLIAIWGAWLSDQLRRESFRQLVELESQQAINRQVTQALHARDEFISIASHELKTPITIMQLQAWLLKESIEKSDSAEHQNIVRKFVQKNEGQIERLLRLVKDMLDLSRIASGKIQLETSEVQLNALIDEVGERYSAQLKDAGMHLTLRLAPEVTGQWDRMRIEQVLSNLFANAIKYAPQKPIEVFTKQVKDQIMIEVRDHGPGVPAEHREKIFDRYDRGNADLSVAGLGLGLYITKHIVEAHKGTILVDPNYQDGASFRVSLPLKFSADLERP